MPPVSLPKAGDMVARSAAMRRVLGLAERVATVDAPVLLTGESGSGKERIAATSTGFPRERAGRSCR